MKNKAFLIVLVSVGSLIAAVGITKASGYWRTESSKVPLKIGEGEFAGEYNPGDIRGSYTFDDIEASFDIPPAVLAEAFYFVSDSPGKIQTKQLEETWEEIEGNVEVGTDSVRLFTALWTALPFEPEETTVLPRKAVEILRDEGKIDTVKTGLLMEQAVYPPDFTPQSATGTTTAAAESHEAADRQVRGLSTFGDLKKWGVSEEAWETATGLPMGSGSSSLKDWGATEGRAMSELKSTAQSLVDAAE